MASTVKFPDPIPCALAAALLPGSCAFGCRARKGWFSGPIWERTDDSVCGRRGGARCAHAARTGVGCQCKFRDNRDLHCALMRCGIRRSSNCRKRRTHNHRHIGVRVRGHTTGRAARCLAVMQSRTCVDARAGAQSSGSFKTVAPVAICRWVQRVCITGMRLTMRTLRGNQELRASAHRAMQLCRSQ